MNKFRCSCSFLLVALFVTINFSQALSASVESNEASSKEVEKAAAEAAPEETNKLDAGAEEVITTAEVTSGAGVLDKTVADANRGRLISALFEKYDKRNYHAGGVFKFGMALTKILVNEEAETVQAHGWLRMNWSDPRLKWNPEDYGGQKVFRLPASEIWKPDISLYNSAEPEYSMRCRETNVLIYSDGHILWVPSCQFDAQCANLTLHQTPYAEQDCLFKFGSWTFDGSLLDLQHFGDEKLDTTYLHKNGDYDVLDSSTSIRKVNYYSCCTEPYVTIDMHIHFQRKANRPINRCGH